MIKTIIIADKNYKRAEQSFNTGRTTPINNTDQFLLK